MSLVWDPVQGADSYNVYYRTSLPFAVAPQVTGIAAAGTTVTGLVSGQNYYFAVTAVRGNLEGLLSAAVQAAPIGPPHPPVTVLATAQDTQVSLSWSASPGTSTYTVYHSPTSPVTVLSGTAISGLAVTNTLVTGLTNNVPYYFIVTGTNGYGEGNPSGEITSTPIPPPGPPAGVGAAAGDAEALISWTATATATSYMAYWGTAPGVTIGSGTPSGPYTGTSGTVSDLTNGIVHYFIVTAINSAGEGAASNEVSAQPLYNLSQGDPLYGDQWHLKNTGQQGGTAGEDINVEPVWTASNGNLRGQGVRIAVVDDGLEIGHEDISANVLPGTGHDYTGGGTDPTGGDHGTSVAGVAAARDGNAKGGRGTAPRAGLVGYNLLQAFTTANQSDAMLRAASLNGVSSNSWGPPDGDGTLSASPQAWKDAIVQGLLTGRGGNGIIYSWAAGNGHCPPLVCAVPYDNANYDGYANFRGVVAVCGVGDTGKRADYSEKGANLWVCAPTEGDGGHAITTTDRTGSLGYNAGDAPDYADPNYTNSFNGTSSATPVVSGVAALVVQAEPALTWRDVREILAQTARKNDPTDADWFTNAAGYHINHSYGFGVVDADAAVTAAQGWTPLASGDAAAYQTSLQTVNSAITDNSAAGVSDVAAVLGSGTTDINQLEWVEVTLTAVHAAPGQLQVELSAPSGTKSVLAERHLCPSGCSSYSGWVFGSARHLGEDPQGDWTLTVSDRVAGTVGTFNSWRLKIYGR